MTFKSSISNIKETLKSLLTSELSQEEIDAITSIDKKLDDLSTQHENVESEVVKLKDKLVDMVKTTSFKTDGKDETPIEKDKSIDDIMLEEMTKIENRKEK